ncbi:hypothetical protein Emag_002706 [Eimeria magna]
MATSLLFQALQERGSARLQELHAAISSEGTRCPGASHGSICQSCCNDSDGDSAASAFDTGDACGTCVAHCIKSLSFKLTPPAAPHTTYIPSKYRKPSSSRNASVIRGPRNDDTIYLEGRNNCADIFAIDSASLASAAYPRLAAHLCGLGEETSTPSWLVSHVQGKGNRSVSARNVVWVELWWLQPSTALSSQLRLWGNDALSRGHTAAAEALYIAALALLPSCEDTARLSAVLHANKSLASLRLGKVAAALRAATEAAAADPTYRKAWHRRASALSCLRDLVRRHCAQSRTDDRGDTLTEIQACLHSIDLDFSDAQRLSQSDVTAEEAAAAAQQMVIGTCGCGMSSASSSQHESSFSGSACLWLREDVHVMQTAKGRGLVCDERPSKARKDDPCLVLEEEAFALFVHPKQCADVPKLPFSKAGLSHQQCISVPQNIMQLHRDSTVRLTWEKNCEEVAKEKSEGSLTAESAEDVEHLSSGAQGACAGCAAVPRREEAAASGGPPWSAEALHALMHQLMRPTLSAVPCGSCAAALFCCNACRAQSSHKRVCRQGNQHRPMREDSMQKVLQQQNAATGSAPDDEGGAEKGFELGRLVRPWALAVQDPHRHIARQLLSSLLPRACISDIQTQEKAPQCSIRSRPSRPQCDDDLLGKPVWQQLLKMTATVLLDSKKLTDWLLNAACIASEAYSHGQGKQCGGRCLLCNPAIISGAAPSALLHLASSVAGSAEAAEQSTIEAVKGPTAELTCKCCCLCCKAWCMTCSNPLPLVGSTESKPSSPDSFPRCLFAAALHAYGVACCNSFTVRVLCDPEEDAVAAGTAFYLAASLLNHSCAPNAIALFGEPNSQRQRVQHQVDTTWKSQMSRDQTPSSALRSGAGRGTLIQIRLCLPGNKIVDDSKDANTKEICISYGPVVGLENSSWGCRQDWLLRNAGFYCHCETCSPSLADSASSDAGTIAFEHEFFDGVPCPICTAIPRFQQLLGFTQQLDAEASGRDMLSRTIGLMRDLLAASQESSITSSCRQHQQSSPFENLKTSIYLRLSDKTTQLVASLGQPAFTEQLSNQQGRQQTTAKALALLGHSCMALWSHAPPSCSKASPIISCFLSTKQPLFVCNEFQCIECGSLLPAEACEKARHALQRRLDQLRRVVCRISAPSPMIDHLERYAKLTKALQETVQTIPSAVTAGGLFSVFVWQALQAAARTAYLLARHSAGDVMTASSARSAAACLLAGVNILIQRFPLGSAQPELYGYMYKAALLCGQAGDAKNAGRLATAALKYTASSWGLLSVIHSSIQDLQRWMQLEHSSSCVASLESR